MILIIKLILYFFYLAYESYLYDCNHRNKKKKRGINYAIGGARRPTDIRNLKPGSLTETS